MSDTDILTRLILATLLGGLVGMERQIHHKPAGLRTHILVCIGACMCMMIGLSINKEFGGGIDPSRIAAQVVSGIGFLGAGTIMVTKASVKGLTTAASIWATSALGLAIGNGMFFAASVAAVIMVTVLLVFEFIEERFALKASDENE
ncbi:MAG: MgtC/SapB family protein [bacterium]|nr:MgtC/SapB family protein [bacterium]